MIQQEIIYELTNAEIVTTMPNFAADTLTYFGTCIW